MRIPPTGTQPIPPVKSNERETENKSRKSYFANNEDFSMKDYYKLTGRVENSSNLIKSHIKTYMVRKRTVFPSEIENFLEKNIGAFLKPFNTDIEQMSKILAREIMSVVENPKEYSGHGKRLEVGSMNYPFPMFDEKGQHVGKETIKLPLALWVRQLDKDFIELEMVGELLGSGVCKYVRWSKPLQIDLRTLKHEKKLSDMVEVECKSELLKPVLSGLSLIERKFSETELKNPELRLGGRLSLIDRQFEKKTYARDIKCHGDLIDTYDTLAKSEILHVFSDVGTTLKLIHKKNLVHCDVKPENILLAEEGNRGVLSDHDFMNEVGNPTGGGTLYYADKLRIRHGVITPFADTYGLAKSLAAIFFGIDNIKNKKHFLNYMKMRVKGFMKNNAQLEAYKCLRDAIALVLKENELMDQLVNECPEIIKFIKARNPAGMMLLNSAFEGHRTFFDKIEQAKALWRD